MSRGGALAQVKALATETAGAFRDLLKLNHRMGRIQARTRLRAPCAPAGAGLHVRLPLRAAVRAARMRRRAARMRRRD